MDKGEMSMWIGSVMPTHSTDPSSISHGKGLPLVMLIGKVPHMVNEEAVLVDQR